MCARACERTDYKLGTTAALKQRQRRVFPTVHKHKKHTPVARKKVESG